MKAPCLFLNIFVVLINFLNFGLTSQHKPLKQTLEKMEIALQRASFRVPVSDAQGVQPRVGP